MNIISRGQDRASVTDPTWRARTLGRRGRAGQMLAVFEQVGRFWQIEHTPSCPQPVEILPLQGVDTPTLPSHRHILPLQSPKTLWGAGARSQVMVGLDCYSFWTEGSGAWQIEPTASHAQTVGIPSSPGPGTSLPFSLPLHMDMDTAQHHYSQTALSRPPSSPHHLPSPTPVPHPLPFPPWTLSGLLGYGGQQGKNLRSPWDQIPAVVGQRGGAV